MFNSVELLKSKGFVGFYSIKDLQYYRGFVSKERGVYMVLYKGDNRPSFLIKGTGGCFKGRDKNVPISVLEEKWVNDTIIIYIGQAGGIRNGKWSEATLNDRIDAYIRYGMGEDIGHEGGRYIWQIENNEKLELCWKILPNKMANPEEVECDMILNFKSIYGRFPFANIKGCRRQARI